MTRAHGRAAAGALTVLVLLVLVPWCTGRVVERGMQLGSGHGVWVRNGCASPIVVERMVDGAGPGPRDVRALEVSERRAWGIGFAPIEDVTWRVGASVSSLSEPRSLPVSDGPEGLPLLSVMGADCPAAQA